MLKYLGSSAARLLNKVNVKYRFWMVIVHRKNNVNSGCYSLQIRPVYILFLLKLSGRLIVNTRKGKVVKLFRHPLISPLSLPQCWSVCGPPLWVVTHDWDVMVRCSLRTTPAPQPHPSGSGGVLGPCCHLAVTRPAGASASSLQARCRPRPSEGGGDLLSLHSTQRHRAGKHYTMHGG